MISEKSREERWICRRADEIVSRLPCWILLIAMVFATGPDSYAAGQLRRSGDVVFYNLHTNERLKVAQGEIPSPNRLSLFFRCKRDNRYTLMDPRLGGWAMAAARHFGQARIELISAFRTSRVNKALHAAGRQVARKSRHTHGQALDLRIVGVKTHRSINVIVFFRQFQTRS